MLPVPSSASLLPQLLASVLLLAASTLEYGQKGLTNEGREVSSSLWQVPLHTSCWNQDGLPNSEGMTRSLQLTAVTFQTICQGLLMIRRWQKPLTLFGSELEKGRYSLGIFKWYSELRSQEIRKMVWTQEGNSAGLSLTFRDTLMLLKNDFQCTLSSITRNYSRIDGFICAVAFLTPWGFLTW